MKQTHTLAVKRRVIRADGQPRPGDHEQVVAFYSEDGDAERVVGGTGFTPLAEDVHVAQVSDAYLSRMERLRWEQERKRR